MTEENKLVKVNPKTVYAELQKFIPQMGAALPKHLTPERMARIALTQLRVNPKLFTCTAESFYASLMAASQLGLEPGINGQCYLIPYWNNKLSTNICTLVPGWRGYMDLLARSGRGSAWTGVVRPGDFFEYSLGSSPKLDHKPGDNAGGAWTHVYAVGWVKGAQWPVIEVWSRAKVDAHLSQYNKVGDRHYAKENEDNYEMYGRKVVLLQVLKYLPSSIEIDDARALDLTASEERQNLTIDMALHHEFESGADDNSGSEAGQKAAELAEEINKLFAELGETKGRESKWRKDYKDRDAELRDYLKGLVAKKQAGTAPAQDAKKPEPTKQEPTQEPEKQAESSPAESLFTEPAQKQTTAPPPIDASDWS